MKSEKYINMCIETIDCSIANVKQEQIIYSTLKDYLDAKEKKYYELLKNKEIYLNSKKENYLNLLQSLNYNIKE
ncbi:MAG: hypothetical protein WCH77_12315 [Planctomycetota bacterium]